MDKANTATTVDATLGDDSAWEEPTRAKKSERRQRAAMVSVRLRPEELATIQTGATRRGISLSAYLRECALADARRAAVTQHAAGGFGAHVVGSNAGLSVFTMTMSGYHQPAVNAV